MTYSITRGVPEAGIAFAFAMMIGICVVLSLLALMTVLFRQSVSHLVENRSHLLGAVVTCHRSAVRFDIDCCRHQGSFQLRTLQFLHPIASRSGLVLKFHPRG